MTAICLRPEKTDSFNVHTDTVISFLNKFGYNRVDVINQQED